MLCLGEQRAWVMEVLVVCLSTIGSSFTPLLLRSKAVPSGWLSTRTGSQLSSVRCRPGRCFIRRITQASQLQLHQVVLSSALGQEQCWRLPLESSCQSMQNPDSYMKFLNKISAFSVEIAIIFHIFTCILSENLLLTFPNFS